LKINRFERFPPRHRGSIDNLERKKSRYRYYSDGTGGMADLGIRGHAIEQQNKVIIIAGGVFFRLCVWRQKLHATTNCSATSLGTGIGLPQDFFAADIIGKENFVESLQIHPMTKKGIVKEHSGRCVA
jgi:hypothetical protein